MASRAQPLNPVLKRLLENRVGVVVVQSPGVAAKYGKVRFDKKRQMRVSTIQDGHRGEYYRVNCPYCGDQAHRLYVHHLYMTPDPISGEPMRHLAYCFNESCLGQNAADFEHRVFKIEWGRRGPPPMPIAEGKVVADVRPRPPGIETPLQDLPPTHHACRYLAGRGFDPAKIGRAWGATYCVQASNEFPAATGRIIVPVVFKGEYRGWQARYPDDVDWKKAKIQKYFNLPGMQKMHYLYNYDAVRDSRVVVVCEGVTDAWVVGKKHGVCLFGKRFSQEHLACLRRRWGKKGGLCVVALDPDAISAEGDRRAYASAMESLRSVFGRKRLVELDLPGKDPGSMTRKMFWTLVAGACDGVGVDLSSYKDSRWPGS